jgi:hypothetical protein
MQRPLDSQHVDVCLERFKRIDILRAMRTRRSQKRKRSGWRPGCDVIRCAVLALLVLLRAPAAATRERGM